MKYLILISMVLFYASAQAANEGAHGGDIYALEFTNLGYAAAESLNLGKDFKTAVDGTRIVSKTRDNMILNEQEVAGLNFPDQNLIEVNQESWRQVAPLHRFIVDSTFWSDSPYSFFPEIYSSRTKGCGFF
jgi:hypothetical protein